MGKLPTIRSWPGRLPQMRISINRTKKDLVVAAIREAILSGEFQPGEKILQDTLAGKLKISPTPVREAIRQLEAEGVLEYMPHRGVRVSEVTPEDVREFYIIRSVLEPLATRYAVPNVGKDEIQELRGSLAKMEARIKDRRLDELRIPDYEFHMGIYESAGMPELLRMIVRLWTRLPYDTLRVLPGRAAESAREHKMIIDAIESGSAEESACRMSAHLSSAFTAMMSHLTITDSANS